MTERQSGCFDSEMIKIRHITKNFDKIRSLDDVSAVIRQGSIFGLVGSNGAGKSTLLRIMCGIYKPDPQGAHPHGLQLLKEGGQHVGHRGRVVWPGGG